MVLFLVWSIVKRLFGAAFIEKPKVFGVVHHTYEKRNAEGGEAILSTKHVSSFLKLLEKERVHKLGLEGLSERRLPKKSFASVKERVEYLFPSGDERFMQALAAQAKRKRISAVSLEEEGLGNPLLNLHLGVVVARMLCQEGEVIMSPHSALGFLREFYDELSNNAGSAEGRIYAQKARLLEMILREFPNPTLNDLAMLDSALTFSRSLSMYQKAVAEKASHIVLGAAHAEDLALARGVKPVFVNYSSDLQKARERRACYKQYKPLLKRIEEAARLTRN